MRNTTVERGEVPLNRRHRKKTSSRIRFRKDRFDWFRVKKRQINKYFNTRPGIPTEKEEYKLI